MIVAVSVAPEEEKEIWSEMLMFCAADLEQGARLVDLRPGAW